MGGSLLVEARGLTKTYSWLDGRAVATRLNRRSPEFAVLYISGWFDHPDFAVPRGETVLKVPFSCDELMQAIDLVRRRAPASH